MTARSLRACRLFGLSRLFFLRRLLFLRRGLLLRLCRLLRGFCLLSGDFLRRYLLLNRLLSWPRESDEEIDCCGNQDKRDHRKDDYLSIAYLSREPDGRARPFCFARFIIVAL